MGEPPNGTTRESTKTDLVVRSGNEGSADTTAALNSLINPSDPTPKLKRVQKREKVYRMRQILHLVILDVG